jgi:hypothetical protein
MLKIPFRDNAVKGRREESGFLDSNMQKLQVKTMCVQVVPPQAT